MNTTELIVPIVTLLLGGGAVTTFRAVFRGVNTLRGGARALEREAVADLAKAREAEADRAEWAEVDRDYWRNLAGRRAYQLTAKGIEPIEPDPTPPSARRGHTKPSKPG